MLIIAWKNMRAAKAQFAFSVAGIAVAALLLAFVLALYRGFQERVASYVEDVPADLWVVQDGNESFFSASLVPEATIDEVEKIEGVTGVDTLLGRSLKVRHGNDSFDSYILGFDQGGAGGPLKIKKGSGDPGDAEIILDDVLARTAGIDVGDEVTVGDRALKVVGISTGGNVIIYTLSFVSKDEARQLVGIKGFINFDFTGFVNFGLVRTEPGQDAAVASRINEDVEGVNAFLSEDFASKSRQVVARSMLPILAVIVVLVFVVGSVVVGLTIYTATVEKEREFGVMKAMGTPNKFLLIAVVEQSLICGLIGFLVGEATVVVASRFAERVVPQFVTLLQVRDAFIVFGAVALMSVLAAYLPVQKVLRVDPLRVFKA